MSRSLFVERFTATFRAPPMHLLKQIRLHRASDLLRNTDLPVKTISRAVGYGGRSYFSRAFKGLFGVDPKSYRKQLRCPGPVGPETLSGEKAGTARPALAARPIAELRVARLERPLQGVS